MRSTVKTFISRQTLSHQVAVAAALLCLALVTEKADAESAYIQQVTVGSAPASGFDNSVTAEQYVAYNRPSTGPTISQIVAPTGMASNFAKTVTVGNTNKVAQIQAGQNDTSMVSTFGTRDNVGVIQGSNNQLSNIAVLGTGLDVAVLQAPNSAPINMLIARLPNGSILIKK